MVGHQAEQPRGRIARLRQRGYRTNLNERKSQCPQRIESLGILVESGGDTYWGKELDPEHLFGQSGTLAGKKGGYDGKPERYLLGDAQHKKSERMGFFGRKPEKYRAYKCFIHRISMFVFFFFQKPRLDHTGTQAAYGPAGGIG